MRRHGWWLAAALVTAAAAAWAVLKVWPVLYPEVAAVAALDPDCDLHQRPCDAHFPGGGRVQFALEPKSIPPLKPLRVQVRIADIEASGVEVDFTGVGMNMGFNRPRLQSTAAGRYEGEATLPVCVRERMDWEARVLVRTQRGLLAAPFRFSTFKQDAYR